MSEKSQSITSVRSLTLDLPPSCIEFCPAHPTLFVVGTYDLQAEESSEEPGAVEQNNTSEKKQQNRNGTLIVFELKSADLVQLQTVQYPSAIFDLHFHPVHTDVLAVVSSTGTVSFFRLAPSGGLEILSTHSPLGVEGVLFTYCVWHPVLSDLLAITTADFHVHVLRIDEDWNVHVTDQEPVASHSAEAWVAAFSPTMPPRNEEDQTQELSIFSGGDDSKLLSTTLSYTRPEALDDDDTYCIKQLYPSTGFKGHGAGVTAILPMPVQLSDNSSIVVTGSYDDHIRIYKHFGAFRPPQLLAEEYLGGGVWRIRTVELISQADDQWRASLLVSCMHAGARIVEIVGDGTVDGCKVEVLARFEEHKSMNYGSDYAPETRSPGTPLQCVSISFYDRLLCLWEYTKLE